MKRVLLISHVKVLNANAISSPYTIGFPAITAFLGCVHALQRHLHDAGFKEVVFKSTAIICHEINLQIYKDNKGYVASIIGTGNPLDENGKKPSFIAEGRCHLDVSLAIEYEGIEKDGEDKAKQEIERLLHAKMKLASGDILKFNPMEFLKIDGEQDFARLKNKLMPGYVIIERRELMEDSMKEGLDAMDAMLKYLKVMHRSNMDSNENVEWTSSREIAGWIVPIATGFHGITQLNEAKNRRDDNTPHRFAESVVTLGEFVMPYRIKNLNDMLWHYHTDLENDLYICQQNNRIG